MLIKISYVENVLVANEKARLKREIGSSKI